MGIFSRGKPKKEEAILQMRASLHDDWQIITSEIVKTIKLHWNVLEGKFDQYIDEDEYGNRFIDDSLSSDFLYFSHKVVLPNLKKLLAEGQIRGSSFAVMPNFLPAVENLYGIKYDDSHSVIAEKFITGLVEDGECVADLHGIAPSSTLSCKRVWRDDVIITLYCMT